jgi:hypothetical protein
MIFSSQTPGPRIVHGKVSLKSDPAQFGECDLTISTSRTDPAGVLKPAINGLTGAEWNYPYDLLKIHNSASGYLQSFPLSIS